MGTTQRNIQRPEMRPDGKAKGSGSHLGGNLGFNDQAIFAPKKKKLKGWQKELKRNA